MIELKNISKSFGSVKALSEMSLTVNDKDRLVIAGPSGCGKTTLLRLIAGLETPNTGEILFDGELVSDAVTILAPQQRNIGFVFQRPALWPHMTVQQNIAFGMTEKQNGIMDQLLKETALDGLRKRFPHQLSGGEERRVAIARAVAPHPKYLLMDEPLVNLDRVAKTELLDMILKLVAEANMTLIYVTHDHEEADRISSNIKELT